MIFARKPAEQQEGQGYTNTCRYRGDRLVEGIDHTEPGMSNIGFRGTDFGEALLLETQRPVFIEVKAKSGTISCGCTIVDEHIILENGPVGHACSDKQGHHAERKGGRCRQTRAPQTGIAVYRILNHSEDGKFKTKQIVSLVANKKVIAGRVFKQAGIIGFCRPTGITQGNISCHHWRRHQDKDQAGNEQVSV